MSKIVQDFIPKSNGNRPGYSLTPEFITIHETANTASAATAEMHARYVKNPTTAQSWHFTVDDGDTIYQHLPLNENGWHAGDGASGNGNRKSIGIEICVNRGGDFEKAKANAASLTKKLMSDFGIPISKVVAHRHWSGKNCPTNILRTGGIEAFRGLVTGSSSTPSAPKPAPKPSPSTGGNKQTGSIVEYLNSKGINSSMENRKKLAEANGIRNYSGTAQQNTELLNKLRNGGTTNPVAPKPAAPKGNQSTGSIVVYLDSIGANSSFNNRKRLAEQNGIRNYTGTASQNTNLLNKLRGGGSTSSSRPKARAGEGIVAYMNRVGMDSSYANRARLAQQHGISNYRGTASQNSTLLNRISG